MKTLFRLRPVFLFLAFLFGFLKFAIADEAEPEIRGFWIDAWQNHLKTPAGIDRIIADAKAGNFNSLIAQVRRRGDTLYFSDIEPRIEDAALPSDFDALQYLIDRAHAQNPPLEVHAWIVAYPIWSMENRSPRSSNHVFNKHPEWLSISDTGGFFENGYQHDPGHPGVQQHLFDVSMELVTKYDIDGLHFDYIRLTGNNWGYNSVSVERFQKLYNRSDIPGRADSEWRQFRRDQITQTLRKIYVSAIEARPEVKISAATITWAPGPRNLNEWRTRTSAYLSVLQDWRGWMEEGILDLNIPMAYFREHTHPVDWKNWINFTKDHQYQRHAALGPAGYLNTLSNEIKQMRDTREPSPAGNRAKGFFVYSYQQTDLDSLPFSTFARALTQPSSYDPVSPPLFAESAPIPEMPWKTNPTTGHLKGFVYNAFTKKPVDGAMVSVSGEEERVIQTDATGFYAFVDLGPGDYLVSATWSESERPAPETMLSVSVGEVVHQDLNFAVPGEINQPEVEVIVDNEDPEVTYSGEWLVSNTPGGYGPTYHYALTHPSEVTAFATYSPELPIAGLYRIDTWYFESWNRAPDARFTISDGENEELVFVDQENIGRRWVELSDEIYLDPAKNPSVRIDNRATNNVVLADAIRWRLLDGELPEPDLDFPVSVTIVGKGRVEGLPEEGMVSHGSELSLSAVGENGFRFSHWSGNAWGDENPLTFEVGGGLEIAAVFESAFEAWLDEQLSEEEREKPGFSGIDADPFGHGIPNLLKYAFGLDFRSPDFDHLPKIEVVEGAVLLRFRRRIEAEELDYRIVLSPDLVNWENAGGQVSEFSSDPIDEDFELVWLKISDEGADQRFVRFELLWKD